MTLDVAIELTIPDNTAFTVLLALRSLGYPNIERVERADLLEMKLSDEIDIDATLKALSRAEIVFNPNKHRLAYALIDGALVEENVDQWEARVGDREDDTTRLSRLLTHHFGVTGLQAIGRAVIWRLYDDGGPASKDRMHWACDALFCNAHSQVATVRRKPVRRQVGEVLLSGSNAARS